MWKEIEAFFCDKPAKLKLARLMVELGFSVDNKGNIVCGGVEIIDSSIAKAAGIDRRIVRETVKAIQGDSRMRKIFSENKPAGSFLKDIAPTLGYGVLEVRASPEAVGVISRATTYIAEAGVPIRQILAEDPDFNPDPKLIIITERQVPGEVVSKILTIPTVKKISLS
jgi:predicted regulator of amino acid metabolism with ACT domain